MTTVETNIQNLIDLLVEREVNDDFTKEVKLQSVSFLRHLKLDKSLQVQLSVAPSVWRGYEVFQMSFHLLSEEDWDCWNLVFKNWLPNKKENKNG